MSFKQELVMHARSREYVIDPPPGIEETLGKGVLVDIYRTKLEYLINKIMIEKEMLDHEIRLYKSILEMLPGVTTEEQE